MRNILLALLVMTAACGDSPAEPLVASGLAGTWSGQITFQVQTSTGSFTTVEDVRLSLNDSGTGTWTLKSIDYGIVSGNSQRLSLTATRVEGLLILDIANLENGVMTGLLSGHISTNYVVQPQTFTARR